MKIEDYLDSKGITYQTKTKELITKCLFGGCDDDSTGNEAHLYFKRNDNGQYDCKKCGAKGNLITLKKHFGDIDTEKKKYNPRGIKFDDLLVEKCHYYLPPEMKEYLNNRGISDEVIKEYKLGYGKFYNKNYITIPIPNSEGSGYSFFKLRRDPRDGNDKITYPNGTATLFGKSGTGKQILGEGELDVLALISQGINAVTSTHGANTFKQEWVDSFKECESVYVCFDNDEAGLKGSTKALETLNSQGYRNTYIVKLPEEIGDKGDITDYLIKLKYPTQDLFDKYSSVYPEPIDISDFKEMGYKDIVDILEPVIKRDHFNKAITFLCLLTAYTDDSQFNVMFSGPSSTGKSYIVLTVSKVFPVQDLIKLGGASKQAFFHEQGTYDKEKNQTTVDLSRKILIFTDMPHSALLEGLRSFLSHDEKIMYQKITDKDQKGGNRTKTIALKGFPSVVFCTASTNMDFQEQTRFFVLSPESNTQKVLEGIHAVIERESDSKNYVDKIENDPDMLILKKRILAIRNSYIKDINIVKTKDIEARFNKLYKRPQPRHSRDVKRLLSLIKAFALLNMFWRKRDGDTIEANEHDIEQAFLIWNEIAPSQDYNLPPAIYEVYEKVILPLYKEKNLRKEPDYDDFYPEGPAKKGVTRQEMCKKYYEEKGHILDPNKLRQSILPSLESAGFIFQESNPDDKRNMEIFPTFLMDPENNSENKSGVKDAQSDNKTGESQTI